MFSIIIILFVYKTKIFYSDIQKILLKTNRGVCNTPLPDIILFYQNILFYLDLVCYFEKIHNKLTPLLFYKNFLK